MFRLSRALVGVSIFGFLIHGYAEAQTVSLAELPDHVNVGDSVSATGVDGSRFEGRIAELTGRSLTLSVNDTDTRTLELTALAQIVVRDSQKNGALIGLAAGAIPGAALGIFISLYCENEGGGSQCQAAPFVLGGLFGGAGAAIGAGIDGLIRRTIKFSPSQGVNLKVSPVVRADRQGMRMSIQF